MADTIRTRAALLALLTDNITGNISAQDMRDVLVSLFGVYGMISTQDGSTAQNSITSFVKLANWTHSGPSLGLTPAHASGQIMVDAESDGLFLALFQCSFMGSPNNTTFGLHLFVDGVDSEFGTHRRISSNDTGSASGFGILTLTGSQVVDLRVEASQAAAITVSDAQLALVRLG